MKGEYIRVFCNRVFLETFIVPAVFIHSFALLALIGVSYAAVNCPKEEGDYAVTVGNPNDCSTFYICDKGYPILQKCPGGLEYNSALGVCDWPAAAGCTVKDDEDDDIIQTNESPQTNGNGTESRK